MKYRKKPVVIEAIQWNGENKDEIQNFCGDVVKFKMYDRVSGPPHLVVKTLEGHMDASIGDYIIRGVQGEFYPCKPDIFELTYEAVD